VRLRDKLILVLVVALGLVALSAGIAVAAGSGTDDPNPADVVSDDREGAESNDGAESPDDEAENADESQGTLTSEESAKASEAALEATDGGTVLETESDDDSAGYEVEIRKADGSEVEVNLDQDFKVVQRTDD
jgi:uncharacterized membrane protein YkoI